MKSLSDFLYGTALGSYGDEDVYGQKVLRSLGPRTAGHYQGAITEAGIRAGLGGPNAAQMSSFGMGNMYQPYGSGSALYQALGGRR